MHQHLTCPQPESSSPPRKGAEARQPALIGRRNGVATPERALRVVKNHPLWPLNRFQIYTSLITNRYIMKDPFLSRRRCYLQLSALPGCSLILPGRVLKTEEPRPVDYIRPGPMTALGRGAGPRSQLLSQGSSRTYARRIPIRGYSSSIPDPSILHKR
jgi:hypothetical protein